MLIIAKNHIPENGLRSAKLRNLAGVSLVNLSALRGYTFCSVKWYFVTAWPFSTGFMAFLLRKSPEVILSRSRAIPTEARVGWAPILRDLQMARCLQPLETDEVARNGVLQRITSARGFL